MSDPAAEIWHPIAGTHGAYEVSSLGRVMSLSRVVTRPNGSMKVKGRVLRLSRNGAGYLAVSIRLDGKRVTRQIHNIVADAFLGVSDARLDVCHNDGDKDNNIPGNLRRDTRKSNLNDMKEHGTSRCGEKSHYAVLQESDVTAIRAKIGTMTQRRIAESFGVCQPTISNIANRKTWAHL